VHACAPAPFACALACFPAAADAPPARLAQDLEPLSALPRLCRLELRGNPVCQKQHYRHFLIARLPALKLLDGARVRAAERAAASAAFGGAAGAAALAAAAAESAAAAAEDAAAAAAAKRAQGPTPQQLLALKAAIAAAATLDEVSRLENALATGVMPADLRLEGDHGAAMET
jgi:U2 small nuclear ribonucleoprotein A'